MKPVFVDTSTIIAIGNSRDAFHAQAVRTVTALKQSQQILVTTDAVLLEFGNAFSPVNLRHVAVRMIEAVRASEKWQCIPADAALIERGFQKFKKMQDKDWGFVDCLSIVAANDLGGNEVFSADHHFEQAGFSILLKK
ncbi:type II toxin-antitoxin system VapC family toxin [Candidatus Electrothrix sp.]|uniref:type II toxin-antitoxin system VapC family toxin n=1 Tax=Candidatus Electrothrix sp. TaxID=2170559 RepID=UPI0040573895